MKIDPRSGSCVGKESCEGMGKTEASLDVQYLMGIAPDVPTEAWY